jgi:hypothetical protein
VPVIQARPETDGRIAAFSPIVVSDSMRQKLCESMIDWAMSVSPAFACGTFAGVNPALLCDVLQLCPWAHPD